MDGEEIFYAVDSPVIRSIKADIQDLRINGLLTDEIIGHKLDGLIDEIYQKIMITVEEVESEIKTSSVECNRVSTEIRGLLLDYINCEIEDVKASQKKFKKEMLISLYLCLFVLQFINLILYITLLSS